MHTFDFYFKSNGLDEDAVDCIFSFEAVNLKDAVYKMEEASDPDNVCAPPTISTHRLVSVWNATSKEYAWNEPKLVSPFQG